MEARIPGLKTTLWLLIFVVDAVTLTISFITGYYARLNLPFFPRPSFAPALNEYIAVGALHVLFIMVTFFLSRLYHTPRMVSRIDMFQKVVAGVAVGAVVAYGAGELFFEDIDWLYVDYPQSMFFYVTLMSVLFTGLGREVYRLLQIALRRSKLDTDNLLIIGMGPIAHDLALRIRENADLGYNMLGIITRDGQPTMDTPESVPVLGSFEQLSSLVDALKVQQVIIALPNTQRGELVDLISRIQRGTVDIKIYPDILAYMSGDMNMNDLGGTPLITVRDIALRGWKLSLKRGLDIFGSLSGLVVLSPFMMLTAWLILRDSEGGVFYTQERMGLDGKPFDMIKFRSMRQFADKDATWTTENDPRITKLGHFLRRSNWDEIPQLINVLLGQMSLVGPRPEQPKYVEEFRKQIPRYMERHREKAGMTGWAQVNGLRGDTSIPQRTAYDLWYVENWSLWLDIKIILRTVYQTVMRKSPNAY
jgi:exopolysaccharide biosynthesis polyprenyl glycosylphosphotransferase